MLNAWYKRRFVKFFEKSRNLMLGVVLRSAHRSILITIHLWEILLFNIYWITCDENHLFYWFRNKQRILHLCRRIRTQNNKIFKLFKRLHMLSYGFLYTWQLFSHKAKMDQAGISAMEKDFLGLQIKLMKAQVEMKRSPLSESIKE